jgi:hypothetical protein
MHETMRLFLHWLDGPWDSKFANPLVWLIEGTLVFIILYKILSARKGAKLFIRRIPGLSVLNEAIGRATEMGKPIIFAPGITGLDVVGLQAMSILSHVVKQSAKYQSRVIVTTADPIMYTLAEEVARDACASQGMPEAFIQDDIRYLSDQQFAWVSGVVGIQHREKVASCLYFGNFFGESLILAENGQMVGAIQVAGTPMTTQIPFFLASCDYTIIGDEYYAASAYLSREPTLLGSLVGQDYGKLILIGIIILGGILATLHELFTDSSVLSAIHKTFMGYFGGG